MANQYKEKIQAALAELDPKNPEHWTDDGLPVTRMVQSLANEPGIKRSDINEVAPGFSRDPAPSTGPMVAAPTETAPAVETLVTPVATEADWKAELHADFEDAEAALAQAKQDVSDTRKRENDAQKARDAALLKMNAAFPPMSHAENIQQYLAHENEVRAAKHNAVGVYGASQLDQAMAARRSRGWSRPQRGQTVRA